MDTNKLRNTSKPSANRTRNRRQTRHSTRKIDPLRRQKRHWHAVKYRLVHARQVNTRPEHSKRVDDKQKQIENRSQNSPRPLPHRPARLLRQQRFGGRADGLLDSGRDALQPALDRAPQVRKPLPSVLQAMYALINKSKGAVKGVPVDQTQFLSEAQLEKRKFVLKIDKECKENEPPSALANF